MLVSNKTWVHKPHLGLKVSLENAHVACSRQGVQHCFYFPFHPLKMMERYMFKERMHSKSCWKMRESTMNGSEKTEELKKGMWNLMKTKWKLTIDNSWKVNKHILIKNQWKIQQQWDKGSIIWCFYWLLLMVPCFLVFCDFCLWAHVCWKYIFPNPLMSGFMYIIPDRIFVCFCKVHWSMTYLRRL